MLDLLIKNARVCDGNGGASYVGYVGIADGKIVEVEQGVAPGLGASRTIDADGLVLSPGFIDPHTHYDAQLTWDPLLTSSPWHGVTTVVQGNCGVGVAPLTPQGRDFALKDLAHVEEIPFELMKSYVSAGNWQTFGEYMDVIQKRGLGINVLPLVPLNCLRRFVMGDACLERAANDDERKKLEHVFRQSINDGAFGWSASFATSHSAHDGRPGASRLADRQELEMLSRVMAEAKTATACMAFDIPKSGDLIDYGLETLSMVANISRQRITYLLIGNDADDPMSYLQTVKKLGGLLDSGAVTPQCMVKPLTLLFHMKSPFTLATFSNSLRSLLGKPFEEQMKHYADPGFRAAVLKEIDETPFFKGFFDRVWVIGGESEEAKGLSKTDKTLATIAKERGVNPIDCWLDIALRDQLETRFGFAAASYEPEGVKNLIRDGRFLPGVADAGAHLTSINDAGYVTHMLGHWCRDKQVVPLEEAVRLTTSFAADVFGVERRGRIVKGNYADLVLFEFEKVGACKAEYVNDLPGGARRMISRATGVNATIVNGQVLYENAIHSGALPGTMLRSQSQ